MLAELIAGDLGKDLQTRPKAAGSNPSDLLVQYVASTFILVLNWWLESKSRPRPAEANDVFRALVLLRWLGPRVDGAIDLRFRNETSGR